MTVPDSPVVRTPCFHCREHGVNPWLGTKIPHAVWHGQKKKKEKRKKNLMKVINWKTLSKRLLEEGVRQ